MTQKTISSTKLRDHLSDVMEEVRKKNEFFIVTKQGKPRSIIADIDFFEDLLSVMDKEFLKSIKEAREQVKRGEVSTFEDVFGEL